MRQLKITKSNNSSENASVRKNVKLPYKSIDEEHEVVRKAQNGDPDALEQLAEAFFGFIESIARQYQNQGLDFPDLIEVGQRGFIKGLENFDGNRGFFFHSYATWWVRKEITDALKDLK